MAPRVHVRKDVACARYNQDRTAITHLGGYLGAHLAANQWLLDIAAIIAEIQQGNTTVAATLQDGTPTYLEVVNNALRTHGSAHALIDDLGHLPVCA